MEQRTCRGLSANTLKLIAVAAMTLDHYAWAFVPTASLAGQLMHVAGRLTAPIMCFFVAEGYAHTRDVRRYALRLGVFALLSHLPYTFYSTGRLAFFYETGVIFTLFLGLAAILVADSALPRWAKALLLAAIFLASTVGDWSCYAVAWVLVFHLFRGDPRRRALGFCFVALVAAVTLAIDMGSGGIWWQGLCQFGTLLAYPLLTLYNGERGRLRLKWFFYIYYPVHLVLLALLRQYLWYGYLW
ncbi:MAG: TraX family protein [Oscillospiraceae bacterium]|nr:TraX family protein [Oscillospiraceae bacterium]